MGKAWKAFLELMKVPAINFEYERREHKYIKLPIKLVQEIEQLKKENRKLKKDLIEADGKLVG